MCRANSSLQKTLMLGKTEGRRRRGQQRTRWLGDIINSMHRSLSKLWEIAEVREAWCAAVPGGCKELDTMEHGNTSKNKDLLCSAGNSISL